MLFMSAFYTRFLNNNKVSPKIKKCQESKIFNDFEISNYN